MGPSLDGDGEHRAPLRAGLDELGASMGPSLDGDGESVSTPSRPASSPTGFNGAIPRRGWRVRLWLPTQSRPSMLQWGHPSTGMESSLPAQLACGVVAAS